MNILRRIFAWLTQPCVTTSTSLSEHDKARIASMMAEAKRIAAGEYLTDGLPPPIIPERRKSPRS